VTFLAGNVNSPTGEVSSPARELTSQRSKARLRQKVKGQKEF
jgi:hypothetical protein